jgi:hypothetical protein
LRTGLPIANELASPHYHQASRFERELASPAPSLERQFVGLVQGHLGHIDRTRPSIEQRNLYLTDGLGIFRQSLKVPR